MSTVLNDEAKIREIAESNRKEFLAKHPGWRFVSNKSLMDSITLWNPPEIKWELAKDVLEDYVGDRLRLKDALGVFPALADLELKRIIRDVKKSVYANSNKVYRQLLKLGIPESVLKGELISQTGLHSYRERRIVDPNGIERRAVEVWIREFREKSFAEWFVQKGEKWIGMGGCPRDKKTTKLVKGVVLPVWKIVDEPEEREVFWMGEQRF